MLTVPDSRYEYLPQVRDSGGKLRRELEEIRRRESPDTSLADLIRRALREYIERQKGAE